MIGADAKLSFQLAQSGNIHLVLLCCWAQGSGKVRTRLAFPTACDP